MQAPKGLLSCRKAEQKEGLPAEMYVKGVFSTTWSFAHACCVQLVFVYVCLFVCGYFVCLCACVCICLHLMQDKRWMTILEYEDDMQ